MINKTQIDIIDQYLLGQMNDAEAKDFEASLVTEPELKEAHALIKSLESSFGHIDSKELRKKMKSWDKEDNASAAQKPREPLTSKNPFSFWISVAAVGILLLGMVWMLNSRATTPSGTQIFADNFKAYPFTGIERSGEEIAIDDGYWFYSMRDYAQTIEKLAEDNQEDLEMKFYLAQAQLAEGQFKKAIENLNLYITKNSGKLINQAKWYRGIAYFGLNENDIAYKYLKELALEENSYGLKAKELLTETK